MQTHLGRAGIEKRRWHSVVSQRRKMWIRLLPVDSRQMSQPTVLRAGKTQPESPISVNESCIHPSQHNDARLHQKTLSQHEKKQRKRVV